MTTLKRVTWDDFDKAASAIADRAKAVRALGIYGVPRGGLPLAVAVSHQAGIPLIMRREQVLFDTSNRIFVVDDIADSGKTLKSFLPYDTSMFAAWFRRSSCAGTLWAVHVIYTKDWIIFPWEDASKAEADFLNYTKSREGTA
jgi:hypoxanthine phosphoribosyltransferase